MNIFETNNLSRIKIQSFNGSKIYMMDNFYKHPQKILDLIKRNEPFYHKGDLKPSYNGIYFQDLRHNIEVDGIKELGNELGSMCGQQFLPQNLYTNVLRFFKSPFNDYINNYWFPHLDPGYTAMIFLNKVSYNSTNLYEVVSADDNIVNEHFTPWRPKKHYKVVKTLRSKYNRMIMFEGDKFFHSMCVENDLFFGTKYRLNQALFFKNES